MSQTATQTKTQNGVPPVTATQPIAKTTPAKESWDVVEYTPMGQKDKIKLSFKIVREFLSKPTKSGVPANDAQCLKFMMQCRARGLNPFEGDAFLTGYDTKDGPEFAIITAHQAFMKRLEACPDFDGMKSGVIVKTKAGEIVDREGDFMLDDDTILGGWAVAYRKNWTHPTVARIKLATFHRGNAFWNNNACGMIVKCAEVDVARRTVPNSLGGLYLQAEIDSDAGARVAFDAPEPPPDGRHSLKPPKVETPPPDQTPGPPVSSFTPPDEPLPAGGVDADAEMDTVNNLLEQIGDALTADDLKPLGVELMRQKEKMSEQGFAMVHENYTRRLAELDAKPAKKSK